MAAAHYRMHQIIQNLSLIELNTMVHQFSSEVHGQQEKIDNIEDNIESAHANINEGTRHLGMASKLKAGVLPVAGALIGTLVAGPIGLVAGAKIGLIGVAAGGALGFAGGRVVKSRQNDITNIEMRNLSEKTSKETPTTDANCNSWNPLNWMKSENKQ